MKCAVSFAQGSVSTLCRLGGHISYMCKKIFLLQTFHKFMKIMQSCESMQCHPRCCGMNADSGTLMGITNTIATIPGFLSPSVVGAITHGNVSTHFTTSNYHSKRDPVTCITVWVLDRVVNRVPSTRRVILSDVHGSDGLVWVEIVQFSVGWERFHLTHWDHTRRNAASSMYISG